MVPCGAEFEKPVGREMQIATDRAGDWLRFVMIVKARQIAPAGVAAQLDQTGSDHDAKPEPAKKPENKDRRTASREWAPIDQWAEKDRQKPGLEQLNLPAVTVPDLANVDNRHVHRPENREKDRIRIPSKNDQRQTETCPCKDRQCVV